MQNQNVDSDSAVQEVINEAYGFDAEADFYKRRAIQMIEERTGLKKLEEVLNRPFVLQNRAA